MNVPPTATRKVVIPSFIRVLLRGGGRYAESLPGPRSGLTQNSLQPERERLAREVVGDVQREPRAEVVDELGRRAQRGDAAALRVLRQHVGAVGVVRQLGRARRHADEIAVPQPGELQSVVERARLSSALGPARLLADLALAPLVLLARQELQLLGEPLLVLGARGA